MNKFINYIEDSLPIRYTYSIEDNCIKILKGNEYIYVFFRQEIEDDYLECCKLLEFILAMEEK